MKFETGLLGFKIVPETVEDAYHLGRLAGRMEGCDTIQRDLSRPENMLVNTQQLAKVDEVLPWQGTGLGRIGFIRDLMERAARDD